MIERPILFSTPMVQAILEGRKTMTRRICKLDTANFDYDLNDKNYGPFLQNKYGDSIDVKTLCPFQIGDILYVRETWKFKGIDMNRFGRTHPIEDAVIEYKDGTTETFTIDWRLSDIWMKRKLQWRPSIHMPRWASRISLEVTDVRVERLQEITFNDILKEGIQADDCRECFEQYGNPCCQDKYSECGLYEERFQEFAILWDSTVKKQDLPRYGWDASPWVWIIEFKV